MGDVDVDDHAGQNGECERNVSVDEEQDGRCDLEEADGDVVVGGGEGSGEVGHGAGRHGRRGNEMEEHVRTEDEKDDAHEVTGDGGSNLHEGPPRESLLGKASFEEWMQTERRLIQRKLGERERQAVMSGADITACDVSDGSGAGSLPQMGWTRLPRAVPTPVRTGSHGGWAPVRWIPSRQE